MHWKPLSLGVADRRVALVGYSPVFEDPVLSVARPESTIGTGANEMPGFGTPRGGLPSAVAANLTCSGRQVVDTDGDDSLNVAP